MDLSILIPKDLPDIAAIGQLIQLIVVIGGFIYAKKQLDELVKSRKLETTKELIKEVGNPELRSIRTWLMQELCKRNNEAGKKR